jgi:hypothetical protein
MMSNETWRNGALISRADDTSRTVTTWDGQGSPTTRAYTAAENTEADTRAVQQAGADNETSIRQKLRLALGTNTDYLAIATPTAAQTTLQVKALSRQANALIRLANQQLDSDT